MIKELVCSVLLSSFIGIYSTNTFNTTNESVDVRSSNVLRANIEYDQNDLNYLFTPNASAYRYSIYGINGTLAYAYYPVQSNNFAFTYNALELSIPSIVDNTYYFDTGDITTYVIPVFQLYLSDTDYFQFVIWQAYNSLNDTTQISGFYTYKNSGDLNSFLVYRYFDFRFVFIINGNIYSYTCNRNFNFSRIEQDSTSAVLWANQFGVFTPAFDDRLVSLTTFSIDFAYYGDDYSDEIFQNGYDNGFDIGWQSGYNTGLETHVDQTLTSLFLTIADTPILMLRSMFDFNVLGLSLFALLTALLTVLFILWVIKKVIH